jgi:hypothetical protein
MKHFLFLSILVLIIIGLYCKTCIEHLTDEESLNNTINTKIDNSLKKIYKTFIDAQIDNKLDKVKCAQGPQGPKGDVGDKATSYQGLYSEADTKSPISIYTTGTQVPSNNIVILKPQSDVKESDPDNSFFILTNKERWQFTEGNEIKSAYNRTQGTPMKQSSNYGICYNDDNKVYICNTGPESTDTTNPANTANPANTKKNYTTFKYTNDNQFITTDGDESSGKCLTLTSKITDEDIKFIDQNKDININGIKQKLTLSECNKNKLDKNQRFFLH